MIYLGKWLDRIQFVCLLLILVHLLYGVFAAAAHRLEKAERRFGEQNVPAVKAVVGEPAPGAGSVKERLLFFYRQGE